jgi:uncharacterized membrane protein YfcA
MPEIITWLIPIAFMAELFDSSVGMGYGTSLTPILLLLGFEPLEIVPAVLLSECITGILAGICHQEVGNADLRPGSKDFKVMLFLSLMSIVGVITAVNLSVSISASLAKVMMGIIVLGIGVGILVHRHRQAAFSWSRIAGLGLLASFNKGLSGGGYGPIVTGGQVLSGVRSRNAVAIASLAEGLTSAVGVIIYRINRVPIHSGLAVSLLIGAGISVPFAAYLIRRISSEKMKVIIGCMTAALGSITLLRIVF